MKNVYSLNAFQINREDFQLNIFYRDDKTGTDLNYVPAGEIKDQNLLRVLGLDNLNTINEWCVLYNMMTGISMEY